ALSQTVISRTHAAKSRMQAIISRTGPKISRTQAAISRTDPIISRTVFENHKNGMIRCNFRKEITYMKQWDAKLYDHAHRFVSEYGQSALALLIHNQMKLYLTLVVGQAI